MLQVYLIAAPEDEGVAGEIADYLKRFGSLVRIETGQFAYPPARQGEVTLALWSRAALMSGKQVMLVNRAIDAWSEGRLVMAQLEHGIVPRGLADLEMFDLTFEPARQHRYPALMQALNALSAQATQARAPDEPNSAAIEGDDQAETGSLPADVPPHPAPPRSKGASGSLAWLVRVLFGGRQRAGATPAPRAPKADQQDEAPRHEALAGEAAAEVFVSYAHADKDAVYPLVAVVEAAGRSVWIDRDDMRPGEGWAGLIVRAIRGAHTVCLMCSERAFQSNHVRREVYLADKYGKALLPIRLDLSEMPEDIEYFLAGVQWVDLTSLPEDERAERVRALFAASTSG